MRNNQNKNNFLLPGFSLFELVIGLLISTILTTICFSIYQKITRSTQFVQKITSSDTKAMILKSRLKQDLIGISPLWFTSAKYEAMAKKATLPQSNENNQEKPKETKDSKEEDNNNDNFFYATENQDSAITSLFSFVTTGGMQMYGSENKMYVRVVYSLKKNSHSVDTFSLYRKEMDPEEFSMQAASTPEKSYEIASGIKKLFIEYGFIDTKKTDGKDVAEIIWSKSWQAKQEKPEEKKQKPHFPKFIKMKIAFIQEKTAHEQEYELLFIIPIDTAVKYQSFTQKNYQQEAQNTTPAEQENTSSRQPSSAGRASISIQPSQTGNQHAA